MLTLPSPPQPAPHPASRSPDVMLRRAGRHSSACHNTSLRPLAALPQHRDGDSAPTASSTGRSLPEPDQPRCSRRFQLMALAGLVVAAAPGGLSPFLEASAEDLTAVQMSALQEAALRAYGNRDFKEAVRALNAIVQDDPRNPQWYEMRAQALVDGKNFAAAIEDYNTCISLLPVSTSLARVLVGRALAYEGLGTWEAALKDYDAALTYAADLGLGQDPYVLNSRGNCYNSLGRWEEAREDYLGSARLFQGAAGFRGRNGSTTPRLDGSIFASSNAALMLVQLGEEEAAVKEMSNIARRAPGSVDMRAALAAMYWSKGRQQEAESQWQFACDQITVGCRKYEDENWLRAIRRWPPAMVAKMQRFLQVQAPVMTMT